MSAQRRVNPDHMAAHGAALLARGYDIIPIREGLKHPGMKGWQDIRVGLRHDAERATRKAPSSAEMVAGWIADPSLTGVGIFCSTVFAIDIDVYDDFVASPIAEAIEARLGVSTRRIGLAPKLLIPYRCEQPMREGRSARYRDPENLIYDAAGKELLHGLDFWGEGRQFVAVGNHPDSGAPYYYDGPHLAELDRDALPLINADDVAWIAEMFDRMALSIGWQAVDKATETKEANTVAGSSDPFEFVMPKYGADLGDIRAMLAQISPDLPGDDYDIAIKAVCHETDGSDEALQLLQDWASQSYKWADSGVKQLKTRWERAKRGAGAARPVRLATLQDWINKGTHAVDEADGLDLGFDLGQAFEETPETDAGEGFPVVDAPAPKKKKRVFSIEMLGDFIADKTPHDWLIHGFLTRREPTMLFADPGSYKSFIALDMGLHIAAGIPWHGHDVKQAPVVYVAGEGRLGLKARADAWCRHHDVDPTTLPFGITSSAIMLNDLGAINAAKPALDEFAAAHGSIGLSIFDTLARNNSADENSNTDMGLVLAHLDLVQGAYNCAAMLIHHSGTTNKDRGRGASAIHGALDSSYLLERVSAGLVRLVCKKMKDAPEPADKWFKAQTIDLGEIEGQHVDSLVFSETVPHSGEVAGAGANPRQGLRGVQLAVYDLIAAEGPVDRETLYEVADTLAGEPWAETARKRRDQVRDGTRKLEAKGLVRAPVDGKIATVEHLDTADGMPDLTA